MPPGTPGALIGRGIVKPGAVQAPIVPQTFLEQLGPLYAWYDASDLPTITDAGGGAVSQWNDKTGHGFHLLQGTAANRPITGTRTVNRLNVLDFDGTNDFLITGGVGVLTLPQPMTVLAVVQTDITNAVKTFVTLGTAGPNVGINATPNWTMGQAADLVGGAPNTNGAHILNAQFAAGFSQAWVDGWSFALGDPGNGGMVNSQIVAGDYPGGGFSWNGTLAEIIIYSGALDPPARLAVEAYLFAKWFGLPSATPVVQAQPITQPVTAALVVLGVNPSTAETVPVPPTIVALAVPQPAPPARGVISGPNPSSVETVPVPVTVQAAAIPPPTFTVKVTQGAPQPSDLGFQVPVPDIVQSSAPSQPVPAAQVTPGIRVVVAAQVQPWAQTIQASGIPQPPPTAEGVLSVLDPSKAETVPVPALVATQPVPQPLASVVVTAGRDPSRVETVPVPIIIQAQAIPPPPVVVSVAPARDPSVVETVPVPIRVASAATPQPLPNVAVTPGLDASRAETVPVPRLVQATNIPQPAQPGFGPFVALQTGNPPVVGQPWALTVQAINIPQPPPVNGQVFVALQAGNAPVTVTSAVTVQATNIPQPVTGVPGVARGLDASSVETVPVPRLVQAQSIPQPPPAAFGVAAGRDASQVETVPLPLLVQAQTIPQPPQSTFGVATGRDASVVETVPVPRFIQATSIPLTLPAAQVLSGMEPSKVETVPLGALVRSKPIEQPPPTVEVRRSFFFDQNQPWAQILHADAIVQPLQRVAVWMNLTPGNPPQVDFAGGAFADSVRAGAAAYATRGSAGSTASSSTVTLEATRGGARVDAERAGEES